MSAPPFFSDLQKKIPFKVSSLKKKDAFSFMCIGVSSACMSVHHLSARCWQSYRQFRATMWMLEMAPWSSGGVVSPLKR